MANVYAVKSGNWSDTTLWNTGSLPAVIDDVYANNFTVYVDISPQVLSVRNLSATSITRGGSFILNDGISLSANVIGGGVDNVFCVRFLSAAPAFASITGNVSTSGSLVNVRQSFALELSGTGTLTVYGSAIGGNNNASGTGVSDGYIQVNAPGTLNIFGDVRGSLIGNVYYGINNKAAGTVNVVGNVLGRTASTGGVNQIVIYNNTTGTVNVTGNIQAGIDNANTGILNNSAGTINILGNVSGGTGSNAFGVWNNSTGTMFITGNVFGSNATNVPSVYNASTGTVTIYGNVSAGGPTGNSFGAQNAGAGGLNIYGNCHGGFGTSSYGFRNTSTGTTTIYGNVIGNTNSSWGGDNNGAGFVYIYGDVYGSNTTTNSEGFRNNSTGTSIISGNVYSRTGAGTTNASTGTLMITGNIFGGTGIGADNTSNGILTIIGNVAAGISHGVRNNSGGNLTVTGNVTGSPVTSNVAGAQNQSTGTLRINGDVFAQAGWGANNASTGTIILSGNATGGNNTPGVINSSTGTVIVYGNVFGTLNPLFGFPHFGAQNNSTGTLIVSGNAVAGLGNTAYGAYNNTTGILRVKRAVGNDWGLGHTLARAGTPGVISNAQGSQTFVEELQCGPRGQWPTGGVIFFTPNSKATAMFETDTLQNYSLIQSNSADNLLPPVSSVRQGEVYDLGMDIGTCIMPPVSSVAAGTLVDNTFGTAVLTPQDTWNTSVTGTDTDSMGGRLRNALNSDSAEKLINSFSS